MTEEQYAPTHLVSEPRPVKTLQFGTEGAYAVYNWELFYHVPMTVAIHLSRNGRYEDAQRWFHYVFDPTDNSSEPAPQRFWKVKPFQKTDVQMIEDILINLSTGEDPDLLVDTVNSIGAWKDAPFRPHLVARYRPSAYMFKTVMAYLDNLVAWGDALFRQDTAESVDEARQLYVLAANVLGPRPQEIPRQSFRSARTYHGLRADLDAMSNAIREVEADLPLDAAPPPNGVSDDAPLGALSSVGGSLYFCVPRNDKLMSYWDTVADRLFKIRNSLNIQGVFRQLPLFDPPIDPAMLARAAAAGLDVGAVVSGLNQPLPLVRFRVLAARAAEICQEVRSLGGQLLSAIEKKDAETLAVLRSRQERVILELGEVVRYGALQEAVKATEALEVSLANAIGRYTHYETLLGRKDDEIVEGLDELDLDALDRMRLKAEEPEVEPRTATVELAQSDVDEAAGHQLSPEEATELDRLADAQDKQVSASDKEFVASTLSLIPNFGTKFSPLGVGGSISFGGSNLAAGSSASASSFRAEAGQLTFEAGQSARIGGYARREQDWTLQSNIAAGEINATFKQLRAAQLRQAVAEREWRQHQQQIRDAREIERFLTDERTGKTSNVAFYAWLRRETRGLYSRCFQLAFDTARKAERALQHELGDPNRTFLRYDYLGGREELLAGERLYLDVKRMELAYQDLNRREYELTKHVSLRQVDPVALIELRSTGTCTVDLPEELFDLDGPGHYFRRLRSVALTIPCVAGPYAGVNCTLTLLSSSVRTTPSVSDGYARLSAEDTRFSDYYGGVQSIVTSSASSDSGLFETNLDDERYLPFEGSGAISQWRLELPNEVRQFDYDTISDVVLHLRYQAREGGQALRTEAITALATKIDEADTVGSVRLLSARHEFATEWARFVAAAPEAGAADLTLTLRTEHYPFWASRRTGDLALHGLELFASPGASPLAVTVNGDAPVTLATDDGLGGLRRGQLDGSLPAAEGPLTLRLDNSAITDLWLALRWGVSS